jgi:hypothetical protein
VRVRQNHSEGGTESQNRWDRNTARVRQKHSRLEEGVRQNHSAVPACLRSNGMWISSTLSYGQKSHSNLGKDLKLAAG